MENSMSRERGISYMVLVGLHKVRREREDGEGEEREGGGGRKLNNQCSVYTAVLCTL